MCGERVDWTRWTERGAPPQNENLLRVQGCFTCHDAQTASRTSRHRVADRLWCLPVWAEEVQPSTGRAGRGGGGSDGVTGLIWLQVTAGGRAGRPVATPARRTDPTGGASVSRPIAAQHSGQTPN